MRLKVTIDPQGAISLLHFPASLSLFLLRSSLGTCPGDCNLRLPDFLSHLARGKRSSHLPVDLRELSLCEQLLPGFGPGPRDARNWLRLPPHIALLLPLVGEILARRSEDAMAIEA